MNIYIYESGKSDFYFESLASNEMKLISESLRDVFIFRNGWTNTIVVNIMDFNGEVFKGKSLKNCKCLIEHIDRIDDPEKFRFIEIHLNYIIFEITLENASIKVKLDLSCDGYNNLTFLKQFRKEMKEYRKILKEDLRIFYYEKNSTSMGIDKDGNLISRFCEKPFNILKQQMENPNNLVFIIEATIEDGEINFNKRYKILTINKEFLINKTLVSDSYSIPIEIISDIESYKFPIHLDALSISKIKKYIFKIFEEYLEEFKQYEGFDRWYLTFEVNKGK